MPRNGSGVYSLPPGSNFSPNTLAQSAVVNAITNDIATDLNTPRPMVAGGTGGSDVPSAHTNLKIAWETIQQSTVSGVSTIDATNLSPFQIIKISGYLDVSSNASIGVVLSTDNGGTFGNVYGLMYTSGVGSVLANQYFPSSATLNLMPTADAGAGNGGAFEMLLFNFNQNNRAKSLCRSQIIQTTQFLYAQYNGYQPTTTARNALRILSSGGTMTGIVVIEGIRG